MKVAFHFSADDPVLNGDYGLFINERFFRRLLHLRSKAIRSDVYCGDLGLHHYAWRVKLFGRSVTDTFDNEKFARVFNEWLFTGNSVWNRLIWEKLDRFTTENVYVLSLDNLEVVTAEELDISLRDLSCYLGAWQVDDAIPVHNVLYSQSLIPYIRIAASFEARIFHEAGEDIRDFRDRGHEEMLRAAGFAVVNYVQREVPPQGICRAS
jgi:hypothetical protein